MANADDRSLAKLLQMRSVRCPCGARIVFAKTVNEKDMPIDLEPSEKGNAILYLGPRIELRVEILGKGKELWPSQAGSRHLPHHATCTKVESFRKAGSGTAG